MPAQSYGASTIWYEALDTAPDLTVCIADDDGPINLEDATVTIEIAYQRWNYYYSPTKKIVDGAPCVVNPDQVTFKGYVSYTPRVGDLQPPGNFLYRFHVVYPSGGVAHYPAQTYLPLVITTPVAGWAESVTGAP